MKKFVLALLVVAVVAAALIVWFQRTGPGQARTCEASALADADTALFLELGDLPGSARRWQDTALAAIAAEPDVQAFLEKPMAKLRASVQQAPFVEPLSAVQPTALFIAVTSISQLKPVVLAGFRHQANKETLDAALAPAREFVLKKFPNGKADLVELAGRQVEVYRMRDSLLAAVNDSGWYLVANDMDALARALTRMDGKAADQPPLAEAKTFRSMLGRLPAARESLLYAEAPPIVERLIELSTASGQSLDDRQIAKMRRIKALGATTSFEGSSIRDVCFVQMDTAGLPDGKLSGDSALTSAQTLFYYAGLLVLPESFQLPEAAVPDANPLAPLASILDRLEAKGLGAAAFAKAFGPEFCLVMDWPASIPAPEFALAVDVSDRALAEKIVTELSSGSLGLPVFAREQAADGTTLYLLPPLPRVPFRPCIGLSDSRLVVSVSSDYARRLLAITQPADDALPSLPAFQNAMSRLTKPTQAMGYLDTKPVFERTYEMLRPTLVFAAALMPGVNDTVDLSKLPATDSIARHLTPIVFSQSLEDDGVLYESSGPITMSQGLVTGAASAAIAAVWAQGLAQAFQK